MASIVPYPRKDDRPDRPTRWKVYITGPGGKRLCRAFRGTKREAQHWAEEQEAAHRARPAAQAPSSQTLRDYLAEWLPSHAARRGIRPRTAESYAFLAQHYILPHLGDVRLRDLTPATLDAWLQRLQTEPTQTRPHLAPATVSRVHQVLNAVLDAATVTDRIPTNPLDRVAKPVARRTEAAAFTPDEVIRIRTEAQARRLGPLFLLCLDLGLRMGEALALRWSDVDLDGGTISVQRGVVELHTDPATLANPKRLAALWAGDGTERRALRREYQEPKTAAGRRAWPLPPSTAASLVAWRGLQASEVALARSEGAAAQDTGLVFTTHTGSALSARNVGRAWFALLDAAGVPRRKPHTTRHTAASRALVDAGLSPVEAAAMLGHASPAITMGVYAHMMDPTRAAAGEKVSAALEREAARARGTEPAGPAQERPAGAPNGPAR